MKFKLSTSGVAGNIRQLVALLGIAESATNAIALPGNIRSVMLASSTLLLAVEHFLDGTSNTTQSAAPAGAGSVPPSSPPAGQAQVGEHEALPGTFPFPWWGFSISKEKK